MKLNHLFVTVVTLTLFGFAAAQSIVQKAEKPVAVETLIQEINSQLNRTYVFPDKAQLIANHLQSQLKKGAYESITDPGILAEKISDDIQSVQKDGHLRVHYRPDSHAETSEPPQMMGRKSGLVQMGPNGGGQRMGPNGDRGLRLAAGPGALTDLPHAQAENFYLRKLEVLPGNIGYLQLNGFTGFVEEAKPVFTGAFRYLVNTEAIIIDLRNGGGGSGQMAAQICSYLFPKRTRLNEIYNRLSNTTTVAWAGPERGENMKLSMPIYILTSKRTFSAGEDFTYALQATKRALVVGETTGGGAHPTSIVDVGQGFVASIPHSRSYNQITKSNWEGTGVIPNIPAPVDEALQKAQEVIFEGRLAKAKTAQGRAAIEWSLTALKAHEYDDTMSAEAFALFVGTYGGRFNISAKGNRFFLTIIQNGRTFVMKPISGTLFLVDEFLQAEFVKNADGKLSLKFVGKPGAEDRYKVVSGERDVYDKT